MKTVFGMLKATLGVALFATLFAQLAGAQCGSMDKLKRSALELRQPFLGCQLRPAAFSSGADGKAEDSQGPNQDPIVGFWRVNFVSMGNEGIPDGTVIDASYAQWHSDGTEITNSSRAPDTGNFCLGTWENVGPSMYKLNHFAIGWNPDGTLLGPANIRQEVTLSRDRNSFSGTFTIDQYDTGGNLLAHLAGTIQAKRITLKTTVADVL